MKIKNYKKTDYYSIVDDILANEEFKNLKEIIHHGGTNRYDHSIRVSYHVYLITKFLKLNYVEATRASLLHDFFFEKEPCNKKERFTFLVNHPKYALENAKKHYKLTTLQEDIILSHMFPISLRAPKFLESWINDLVDDYISVYEKSYITSQHLAAAGSFLLIFLANVGKISTSIR